jgi:large subunit ribosomal protein L6
VNTEVEVKVDGSAVKSRGALAQRSFANAVAGTTRALIANMVTGVTAGFQRKLELVGVDYRAAVGPEAEPRGGFSHPVSTRSRGHRDRDASR